MQKRTYYVIGNPINSSDMLSRTGSTTQWLVDQTNGWGLPNTNTSIGYGVNSRWDAMTKLTPNSDTRKSYLSEIGWLRH